MFRDNVGEGQTEFTLDQFKKIVPSKNVSREKIQIVKLKLTCSRNSLLREPSGSLTRTEVALCPWRSFWRPCISLPTKERKRSYHSCSRSMIQMVMVSLTNQSSGRSSSPVLLRMEWSLMKNRLMTLPWLFMMMLSNLAKMESVWMI